MQRVFPAVPDRQSRDQPIMVPEDGQGLRTTSPLFWSFAVTVDKDVLDLHRQVRDSLEVRYPQAVFILGPPNTLLAVRITRRQRGRSDDVTQHPFKLVETIGALPAEWLQEGDYVVAERR
jgi:hypothetical protein